MKKTLFLAIISLLIMGLTPAMAQDDPFAGLGASDDSTLEAPDGSSSIRAKKKAVPEMFQGRVEKVVKNDKNFPHVKFVKVKITKAPAKKAAPHDSLKKKKSYEFIVPLAGAKGCPKCNKAKDCGGCKKCEKAKAKDCGGCPKCEKAKAMGCAGCKKCKKCKMAKINFKDENTVLNIGAFYLEKGDKVEGVVKEVKDGKYYLEFIQRKGK